MAWGRACFNTALAVLLTLGVIASLPPSVSARDARTVPVKANETGFGLYEESFAVAAPGGLRAAFGEPETVSMPSAFTCRFGWPSLGIRKVELAAFGDVTDACTNGVFLAATLTDPSWHTPRGIHPGGPAKAAKKQAVAKCTKKASCRGGGWILGRHRSECAAARVPSVVARVAQKRVRSLVVFTHGCE
ncbi:MAG: hypothetical protein M3M99_04785 [Actinomycetota bacterium]|nr:hypothetical protein [Actinomycetota bacterium]